MSKNNYLIISADSDYELQQQVNELMDEAVTGGYWKPCGNPTYDKYNCAHQAMEYHQTVDSTMGPLPKEVQNAVIEALGF